MSRSGNQPSAGRFREPALWLAPLAGLLAAAAFPPSPLGFLALVALVPFYRLLETTRRGFRSGFLAGVCYNLATIWWIGLNSDPPPLLTWLSMLGAVAWLSFWWGAASWLTVFLRRRIGPAALWCYPCAIVILDTWVTRTEMGFPWNLLGVTQVANPVILPLAAFGGMHAMTLAVLLVNKFLHSWLSLLRPRIPAPGQVSTGLHAARRWRLSRLAAGSLFFLLCLALIPRFSGGDVEEYGEPVDLLLIQGNVDPLQKWREPYTWCVNLHRELSVEALAEREESPDLLIWPETAIPTRFRYRPSLRKEFKDFCRQHSLNLLTGANDVRNDSDGIRRPYNGSFLLDSTGIRDDYHKIRLVPFGERVPGQRWLPLLGRINLGQAEFAAGEDDSAGRLPLPDGDTLRFAWSICFEGNFSSLARKMVQDGAELLTNQTNDGWFGTSLELDQHLAVSSIRSVETGRWLARSTNNGYTALVDPGGKIVELVGKGERGWIRASVPRVRGETFYVRFGELLPLLCLLLLSWALLLALLGGARSRLTPMLALLVAGLLTPEPAEAGDRYLIHAGSAARVLSMGGCFAANSSFNDAQLYNPAALRPPVKEAYWLLQVDPVPLLGGVDLLTDPADALDGFPPALLALRGLYLGNGTLNIGLLPGELNPASVELLPASSSAGRIRLSEIQPRGLISMALDAKVSLGAWSSWRWDHREQRRRMASAYGILIQANRVMDVGAATFQLPAGAAEDRTQLESIGDRSINVGMLYYPFGRRTRGSTTSAAARKPGANSSWLDALDLQLALDVRNVTENGGLGGNQELHLGLAIDLPRILELRGGIYWPRDPSVEGAPVPSFGLGLYQPLFLRQAARRVAGIVTALDLGWMQNPMERKSGIWLGSLRWAF